MIDFYIKSTISLGILYLFFVLVLRDHVTFKFNRCFLIGALIFSVIFPLIDVPIDFKSQGLTQVEEIKVITKLVVQADENILLPQNSIDADYGSITYIYIFVSVALLFRFLLNLLSISKKIQQNQILEKSNYKLILDSENVLPHSFFTYIIINKIDFENNIIDKKLLLHEIAHCQQLHSIDIIIVELFKIVMWANPFLWLFKKSIQLNHEYLADRSVVSKSNVYEYQELLLSQVMKNNSGILFSNFNFSLIKQRLKMMTKQISRKRTIFGYVASTIVFVLIGATLAFSQKELTFNISMGGTEVTVNRDPQKPVYLQKEFKTSDFSILKIGTNYNNAKVTEFELTLAKGQMAIQSDRVLGNSFNLEKYVDIATGENLHLIIEIIQLSDTTIVFKDKSIIPIKVVND